MSPGKVTEFDHRSSFSQEGAWRLEASMAQRKHQNLWVWGTNHPKVLTPAQHLQFQIWTVGKATV